MARELIIIPGLGDRKQFYLLLKPLWAVFGFRAHIFTYGWDTGKNNAEALQRLARFIDNSRDTSFYIIGISAGGTAAVNILAKRPARIIRVATICTPYLPMPHLHHQLLRQSLTQLRHTMSAMGSSMTKKVLAIYAQDDRTVPLAYSQPLNIETRRLPSRGHALSIFLSLTLFSGVIRRFFR